MPSHNIYAIGLIATCVLPGCTSIQKEPQITHSTLADASDIASATDATKDAFVSDVQFLKDHVETIVLQDETTGAAVAVVPDWQGRVMTATTGSGDSFGWLNRELIEIGIQPEAEREGLTQHIYALGGVDRFWVGPEGGQFSWYFPPEAEFIFENWKVPAFVDTAPWRVISQTPDNAVFQHEETLINWSGDDFNLLVNREVTLLETTNAEEKLGVSIPETVSLVAYESLNTVTNTGTATWTEETGMPSIWILGMLNHGPETTVIVPYNGAEEDHSGEIPIVKDDYFGKVPSDRLEVDTDANMIYFSADGEYRSKIGIRHERSLGMAGSWDALSHTLTIVDYNQPEADANYVNSSWELQAEPFIGDAINAYNDGPVDGGILGPFYEIETSSPALGLGPDESYTHVHTTIHLRGDSDALDTLAQDVFGVSISEIESGL